MSDRTCAVDGCDNPMPTGDNSTSCPGCWNRLGADLTRVPDLIHQLNITLTRQDVVGDHNGPRGTDTPLPYHKGASDALTDLLDTLRAWIPAKGPRLRDNPEAHIGISEIGDATARGWRMVNTPPESILFGPCGQAGCREILYSPPGRDTTKCPACGTEWDIAPRREWLFSGLRGALVTVAEARRMLAVYKHIDVRQQYVSRWKQRGLLTVRQHDENGAEMFLLGDIEQLATGRLDKP